MAAAWNPASRRGLVGIAEIGGDDFALGQVSVSRCNCNPMIIEAAMESAALPPRDRQGPGGGSVSTLGYFVGFAFFSLSISVEVWSRSGNSSSLASARMALVIASVVTPSIPGENLLISAAVWPFT